MSSRSFRHVPISRRGVLKKSALATAALALPGAPLRVRADAVLKPVSMTLDWLYEGRWRLRRGA
jgi:hypothetical protein